MPTGERPLRTVVGLDFGVKRFNEVTEPIQTGIMEALQLDNLLRININVSNITLVVHDWGSALGFHYAMRHESNVKGIAFMEPILRPIPSFGLS